MSECFADFRSEITEFLSTGLVDSISTKQEVFINKLRHLNGMLENVAILNQKVTRDKLVSLFQKIQGEEISKNDFDIIRNLILRNIITEDPSILEELNPPNSEI
jgi:hypothetical protein